ncbi:MAG TPA: hypothetical protein VGE07_08240 [Herpetosiphonaceae bacterium]
MDGHEIVLVDHASALRPWMIERLKAAGYQVSACDNVDFRPQRLVRHPPNLLIIDCLAGPAVALWRLIHDLHAYPDTRHLPILLCTAAGEPQHLPAASPHSLLVLRKPFATAALLELVAAQMPPARPARHHFPAA